MSARCTAARPAMPRPILASGACGCEGAMRRLVSTDRQGPGRQTPPKGRDAPDCAEDPLRASMPKGRRWVAAAMTPSALIALLPKCPLCWAGYMALVEGAGLPRLHHPWLVRTAYVVLVASLAFLHEGPSLFAWRGNGPFCLAISGTALLLACHLSRWPAAAGWWGAGLVVAGSCWSLLRRGQCSPLSRCRIQRSWGRLQREEIRSAPGSR
jgi:hypothetical protein